MHVLPKGFHCVRHYGFLANGSRADNLAKVRAAPNAHGQPRARTTPNVLTRPSRLCFPGHAHAAADACSSLKRSHADATPNIGRPPRPS